MTTVVTSKTIYVGNAHLTRQLVTVYDPATDSFVPYNGGQLVVSFARNADGTNPISGLQNLVLAPATGEPGTYYRVIETAELTGLAALVNTTIYQIVSGGPYNALRVATPMRVTAPRWAQ